MFIDHKVEIKNISTAAFEAIFMVNERSSIKFDDVAGARLGRSLVGNSFIHGGKFVKSIHGWFSN